MGCACMSVDDACRYIGLKRTKMYQMIKNGEVRAIKLGRRTLVTTASLNDLVLCGEAL
ncbi:helix-turn-helix domain-containing protein [Sphingomonas kyungheensis]|uniref:Helix-turn-helix domain-containing protein n=1 Tax=Sphingomonas kyungheensis TaxID=1069987 RepID=A0ABU8H645_9SPHN